MGGVSQACAGRHIHNCSFICFFKEGRPAVDEAWNLNIGALRRGFECVRTFLSTRIQCCSWPFCRTLRQSDSMWDSADSWDDSFNWITASAISHPLRSRCRCRRIPNIFPRSVNWMVYFSFYYDSHTADQYKKVSCYFVRCVMRDRNSNDEP